MKNHRFTAIFNRIFRFIPVFFTFSLAGCVVARYMCGIGWDQVPVAVCVPVAGMFALLKTLVAATPRVDPPTRKPDNLVLSFGAVFVLGLVFAIDFLISAAIFFHLGMTDVINGSLQIAAICFLLSIGGLVAIIVNTVPNLFGRLSFAVVTLVAVSILQMHARTTHLLGLHARIVDGIMYSHRSC